MERCGNGVSKEIGITDNHITFPFIIHLDLSILIGDKIRQRYLRLVQHIFCMLISKGCFDDKDNAVGRIFSVFINNELDKLISPKDVFEKSWDYVGRKLTEAINKDGEYRASVASMMATRIVNYVDAYFDKPGYVSAPVISRIEEMFEHKSFPEDLLFYIVKSVVSRHRKQAIKLLQNPEISNRVMLS